MNKRLIYFLLVCMTALSCTSKENNVCTLRVYFPENTFGQAENAELVLTVNGENGEEDLGVFKLDQPLTQGEWQIEVKERSAASMVWISDPHVGFTFFLEPGEVTVQFSKNEAAIATGTPLNDAYTEYTRKCAETPYQQLDSLTEDYMKRYADTPLFGIFFTNHPSVAFRADKTETERLWALGGENGRKMKYAQNTYERICHNNIENGAPLRDVEIPNATLDGKTVRLSDYIGKGQWVFVDFWASWCVGCRQAIPLVKATYEKVKDGNVLFISIAEWDRRSAALKAMEEEKMPWLQLIDEKGLCGDTYMFNTIPRFMLFAPDGTLTEKDVQRNDIQRLLTDKILGGK